MSDFLWTEELTEYALRNLEHATWAYINPGDMLRAVEYFQRNGGAISKEDSDALGVTLGTKNKDFRDSLKHLRLIREDKEKDNFELTIEHDSEDRPGFYTGQRLGEVIKDNGIASVQAKHILGHNFVLHAREALSFCSKLMPPGLPKDYLKEELLDHYIFNQKLNPFKFSNLLENLEGFGIIKECDFGIVIDYAPPALTFFQMASSYFYLSDSKVCHKVDAKSLLREVENIIPQRDENYSALGFDRFPIENWGKHQAWMTPESFSKMLEIGLVEPERVFRILQRISSDNNNPSSESAYSATERLNIALWNQAKKFKGEPIGIDEISGLPMPVGQLNLKLET
jgi:hypothetical protein